MMTAKEAKEKTDKRYIQKMEQKLNSRIEYTNKAIESMIDQGKYDIDIIVDDLDKKYFLKLKQYYKALGYKVSNRKTDSYSLRYYVVISWR